LLSGVDGKSNSQQIVEHTAEGDRSWILMDHYPDHLAQLNWPSLIAKASEKADVDKNKKGKACDLG
jgi:hypothetical protein